MHPCPSALTISGTVEQGKGQGAFFTQLGWFQAQCEDALGFRPFPGTLNVRVRAEDMAKLDAVDRQSGWEMRPPEAKWCSAVALPAGIGGIPAAVVFPEESVRVHGSGVLEIIAPVGLKAALRIQDGDRVSVCIAQDLQKKGEKK